MLTTISVCYHPLIQAFPLTVDQRSALANSTVRKHIQYGIFRGQKGGQQMAVLATFVVPVFANHIYIEILYSGEPFMSRSISASASS